MSRDKKKLREVEEFVDYWSLVRVTLICDRNILKIYELWGNKSLGGHCLAP